jgi:pyrophosphatase PpaX
MKIKTIIFDVDGVLIDSNKIVVDYYIRTAKVLGLRIPSFKEVFRLLGKSLPEIVKVLWPENNKDTIVSTYRKFFEKEVPVIPATKGAVETVKKLKEMYKLGVVSSKFGFFVNKHLTEAGFDLKFFDLIVSCEDTEKHKPNPDPIIYACKILKVKPEETLYVGDAQYDYESATGAGVNFVAVLTGGLKKEELKKIGAKNIINSVSDLPEFLGLK